MNGIIREEQIGPCRLILGDCLEVLPGLCGVDAVITDPPYGIDYQSARRTDKAAWKPKIANDERPFVWFLHAAFNAASDPACVLCFCRWDVQEAFEKAIGWAGWELKSQVIWDRESHGMGDLNGSPAPQHDVIWFGVRGRYLFHGDRPKSIVRAMRLSGEELVHPNQKPDALMADLVESYAAPGAVVLDCFMGSGSTGIACIRTRRQFIGIETDEDIFETACSRIRRAWQDKCSEIKFDEPEPMKQLTIAVE